MLIQETFGALDIKRKIRNMEKKYKYRIKCYILEVIYRLLTYNLLPYKWILEYL